MIKKIRFPKIFFGWWVVLTTGILTFWGMGFSNFGFSALFKPIASELGLTRATTSFAAGIKTLEGGVLSPVVGWVTDKFGPRWAVLFGVLAVGLGLVMMDFVNSLWAYLLVWGIILGTGTTIGFNLPMDKMVTNWFVKKRGRAMSIRLVFYGLAAVLMLPIVAWLLSMQGWRMTCVIAGVITWIIGVPIAWFFVKQHRPEYYGLLPDGATTTDEDTSTTQMIDKGIKYAAEVEEIEFTLRQAMRTPAYWLLVIARASWSIVAPFFLTHCMPLLTDMGIDQVKAAVMIGTMSIGVIPGMLIGGFIADSVKKQYFRFMIAGSLFLHIIAIAAFLLNQTLAMVYPAFILHHWCGGMYGTLSGIIIARYFGRKAFGSIRGTVMTLVLPISVVAPIYAGWVYDTTGSYTTVFLACMLALILATITISLAFPPKPPAQVTGIHKIL